MSKSKLLGATCNHSECTSKLREGVDEVCYKHGVDHGVDVLGKERKAIMSNHSIAEIVATLAMLLGCWAENLCQMGSSEAEVEEVIAVNRKTGRDAAKATNWQTKVGASHIN